MVRMCFTNALSLLCDIHISNQVWHKSSSSNYGVNKKLSFTQSICHNFIDWVVWYHSRRQKFLSQKTLILAMLLYLLTPGGHSVISMVVSTTMCLFLRNCVLLFSSPPLSGRPVSSPRRDCQLCILFFGLC